MNTYTNCLPAWSVGPDCYKEVFSVVRRYGRTAAVVGGKTALSKAYDKLAAAVAGTGLTLTQPIWYGGNSTYENGDMVAALEEVKNADMVFAVGGGRAVDTCKYVAEKLDKPLFTFPTIASNCAPVTAIGVFYNPDDSFKDYFYPTRCPLHTFIDTQVIAEAPEKLLWAGIGDALSKECEVELCTRGRDLPHTPLMGRTMAACCTDPWYPMASRLWSSAGPMWQEMLWPRWPCASSCPRASSPTSPPLPTTITTIAPWPTVSTTAPPWCPPPATTTSTARSSPSAC